VGKRILIVIVFLLVTEAFGQAIEPKGRFIQRTSKIGEEILYSFSVRYPRSVNLIFPDSTFNYEPFEYSGRGYFTTKSDSISSFDSAVYKLATFEIDTIQFLQLPVYVISDTDCTAVYSQPDSIIFEDVIKEIPQQPEMMVDAHFTKVRKAFNYPYFLAGTGILLLLIFIIMIFFGKSIHKAWRLYLMRKAHKSFTQRFFGLMRDVSSNNPSKSPEQVLSAWKKYMEKLEKAPFTKWTTKEITAFHSEGELKDKLRAIDRSIYADQNIKDLFNAFDFLMKYSTTRYNFKLEEVKNG
jgi:hypothetical protein